MIVSKKEIARMLKISRPTLDKWIREEFVTPVQSSVNLSHPDQILKQLQNLKDKK
jgi:predicted site-specific integrase-resolvase